MSFRDTIDFAQKHFGNKNNSDGLPDSSVRPTPPDWIRDSGMEDAVPYAVPIVYADKPIMEGPAPADESLMDTGTGEGEYPSPDVLAYYLPFHFYKKKWGIYVRASGIVQLARVLTKPDAVSPEAVEFAFRMLFEHERMHFITEYAAAKVEVAFARASYCDYFVDPKMASHEEALANAHAITSTRRGTARLFVDVARKWMSHQGKGYCDFYLWEGRKLPAGKQIASESLLKLPRANPPDGRASKPGTGGRTKSNLPVDLGKTGGPSEFLFEMVGRPKIPMYLVVDESVPWLRLVRPFPKYSGLQVFVHTNDHNPPHIHVKIVQSGLETRYTWPDLQPLPNDQPLSNKDEETLHKYVKRYRVKIDDKVMNVPWT